MQTSNKQKYINNASNKIEGAIIIVKGIHMHGPERFTANSNKNIEEELTHTTQAFPQSKQDCDMTNLFSEVTVS